MNIHVVISHFSTIAHEIVSLIHSRGGRFLKKDVMGTWSEIDDKNVISKTVSQCLREKGRSERNSLRSKRKGARLQKQLVSAIGTFCNT